MEDSILNSTKKILGISYDYTAFDLDIITHINSAFSALSQIGVGPKNGFSIEDSSTTWTDFSITDVVLPELSIPLNQLNMVKTYIFLKTRLIFDPPSTSFAIAATEKQIQEHEWRLNVFREPPLPEVFI